MSVFLLAALMQPQSAVTVFKLCITYYLLMSYIHGLQMFGISTKYYTDSQNRMMKL